MVKTEEFKVLYKNVQSSKKLSLYIKFEDTRWVMRIIFKLIRQKSIYLSLPCHTIFLCYIC